MKDNIDSQNIGNRKFIIELRFEPKTSMLDLKGQIVEKIQNCGVFPINNWEIGQSEVIVRDTKDKEMAKNIVTVAFHRLSYISFSVSSVESFYANFLKIYNSVITILKEVKITRIGCRIIGTYYSKSTSYESLLSNFRKAFPAQFLMEKYPAKDFLFNLVYENGMYQIGPLSENDNFYDREFSVPDCKRHIGVCIDTDNYITNENRSINDKSLIKDIYTLSLSVEKDLLTNLSEY